MNQRNKAVVIDHLQKKFGLIWKNTALDDISMEVEEGKCVAIVGHNGAGKTTLMKIISGIIEKYEGHVITSSRCGFCSENPINFDFINAKRNLKYYYGGNNFDDDFNNIFHQLNLESNIHVSGFSKGMKRKLDIARVILSGNKILLLDEPFDGLDPMVSRELISLIKRLKNEGNTLIISTHQLEKLDEIADDFYFFQNGKILRVMKADEMARIFVIKIRNLEINLETKNNSSYKLININEGKFVVKLNEGNTENDLIKEIMNKGGNIEYFSRISLNDLYLAINEDGDSI